MRVFVTREDIKRGKCGDPWSCPISRAIKRQTGRITMTMYTNTYITWFKGKNSSRYSLPQVAQDLINKFDAHMPVVPIVFDIKKFL